MAAFGKTRRRRELPLKSGLKKVERQLCADSGHLCGVQNLGLWALSSHSLRDHLTATTRDEADIRTKRTKARFEWYTPFRLIPRFSGSE